VRRRFRRQCKIENVKWEMMERGITANLLRENVSLYYFVRNFPFSIFNFTLNGAKRRAWWR